MPRKPLDALMNDGPLHKVSASIDTAGVELARAVGAGDLSLGLRRCLRLALVELERQNRAPSPAMARLSKRDPERVARYYAANPDQEPQARRAVLTVPTTEPAEPDAFAGWD